MSGSRASRIPTFLLVRSTFPGCGHDVRRRHERQPASPPAGRGWEVDRPSVDTAVRDAFTRYRVVGMFADQQLSHPARLSASATCAERRAVACG